MPVYWSFWVIAILMLLLYHNSTREIFRNNNYCYVTPYSLVYLPCIYITIFAGLRDVVLDSETYISTFDSVAPNWESVTWFVGQGSDKGYRLLLGLFKIYISENHYLWFTVIATASSFPIFRFFRKYSCNFALSFFLFIAGTEFSWLFNGARQFIAVAILVGFIDWFIDVEKKKRLYYIILSCFAASLHQSVWFVLPLIYICVRGKLLDKWMLFVALLSLLATLYMGDVAEIASDVMNKQYDITESRGSSFARLFVSMVPVILIVLKFKVIRNAATHFEKFAINMSFVGVCFFFASTFSNGILVGRMPIYFTLYNYLLLPLLLKKYYTSKILLYVLIILYTFFFYYQLCIAWHGLMYVSEILGLSYGN